MTDTIFDTLGWGPWHDHVWTPTPWENRNGRWFKREDYFAPLGYGGPNGSKLRQLIHLTRAYIDSGGSVGILTGASVLSPQVSMAALVARNYGLQSEIVLGGTKPQTATRHPNVRIAAAAGSRFLFVPVGYNPALQRAVRDAHDELPDWMRLHYGITTGPECTVADVAAFHAIGAHQLSNIPPTVTTLAVTMGSANSITSILYGLATVPNNVETLVAFGVGPTRLGWLDDRLHAIEQATGSDIRSRYRWNPIHHPDLRRGDGPVTIEHHDLHATRYATYQDKHPFSADGITFHPTYEGKAMTYLDRHPDRFRWWHEPDGTSAFWIVGSAPDPAKAMRWLR